MNPIIYEEYCLSWEARRPIYLDGRGGRHLYFLFAILYCSLSTVVYILYFETRISTVDIYGSNPTSQVQFDSSGWGVFCFGKKSLDSVGILRIVLWNIRNFNFININIYYLFLFFQKVKNWNCPFIFNLSYKFVCAI